ncbi:cytochrome P450 27C1-like [Physella acuta]|uniref:cytochrome P450 27C1-like n=1 Tax=Physella acuta TaxID=109671 RepID=UPI0027DD7B11|nr:cytochrome P450 27C1-like [Physella acuta]
MNVGICNKLTQYHVTFARLLQTASSHKSSSQVTPQPAGSLSQMPGPGGLKKLPYLGTRLLFQPFSRFTPESLGELVNSLHDKYGAIFKTRLGQHYSVHTDSARDAEAVFRSDGPYPLRRLMLLSKVYRERNGLPPALGTVSGPAWQALRSPLNPLLNTPQVCLHYLPAQNQVADDLVSRLQENLSAACQSELFFKFAAESIAVVCFNQRLGFLQDSQGEQLLAAFKFVLHATFTSMIGIERRYLLTSYDAFYRKYEAAMRYIRQQASRYVEKVKVEVQTADGMESNLLASLVVRSNLQLEQILAIIDSMLIAGTDSTARNLAILLYNLARNPEQQEKARTEIVELIGQDGPVTSAAMAKMQYVKACLKESMRLNFPLANGTERILARETLLSGYLVPQGTSVIMSSSRSSRDPRHFPEPEKFLPERWLRQDVDRRIDPFATLPFGHGARSCIGRRFAEMELLVAMAKLLQKLRVQLLEPELRLEVIYTPFITPKQPIHFRFSSIH